MNARGPDRLIRKEPDAKCILRAVLCGSAGAIINIACTLTDRFDLPPFEPFHRTSSIGNKNRRIRRDRARWASRFFAPVGSVITLQGKRRVIPNDYSRKFRVLGSMGGEGVQWLHPPVFKGARSTSLTLIVSFLNDGAGRGVKKGGPRIESPLFISTVPPLIRKSRRGGI